MAWTAYLLVAQQDPPPYALLGSASLARLIPFLPLAPLRCLKVVKASAQYVWACLWNIRIAHDWFLRYVYYTRAKERGEPIFDTIPYGVPFSRQVLDVYPAPRTAGSESRSTLAAPEVTGLGIQRGVPVLVIVPAPILPSSILGHRKIYLQLALSMRKLGYCVVVPDITYYPASRIRQSVIDLRLALSWVGAHISSYGGNPASIYVMGFGLSAHLVSLTLIQEATVLSHTLVVNAIAHGEESSAGASPRGALQPEKREQVAMRLKNLEIYVPQVRLPQLAGVVLLAGVSDVVKEYRHEMERGIEHLSYLRRSSGPSHGQCLLHSPAHLLVESRGIVDPSFLPPKFLLIHGGKDQVVPISHSTLLNTLLTEAGVKQVEMRAYRELGHLETLTSLLTIPCQKDSAYAPQLLADVREFIS